MHLRMSKKTQSARGLTAADICTNCVYTIPSPRDGGPIPFFWASRPSLPAAWLALLLTKAGDVESYPGSTTYTNKHTPVIWICDLCHKQINKKQTSIRCDHTHNTHWVPLKCTHIQQRQYKPDWRYTIHTPTHGVTATPDTDGTTPHHGRTATHPLTGKGQPRYRNIVILQINMSGIRNKIEELKKLYTAPSRTSSQCKRQNSHRKLRHLGYPTAPPCAQTEGTGGEGAHHTGRGLHDIDRHGHAQGHRRTQRRATPDQDVHGQHRRHHGGKRVLSTGRHGVTALQHRGRRNRMLHAKRHQHTRLDTRGSRGRTLGTLVLTSRRTWRSADL